MKKLLLVYSLLFCGFTFSQSVPYGVNKKKFPLTDEFQKLMPQSLGDWKRYSFHDYLPGLETGHVFYKKSNNQIYVTFGKAINQNDMKIIWTKLYDDETLGKENQVTQKNNTSTTTKYLLMQSSTSYYFAWTHNLYFFSIKTKHKIDADDFMKLFPY